MRSGMVKAMPSTITSSRLLSAKTRSNDTVITGMAGDRVDHLPVGNAQHMLHIGRGGHRVPELHVPALGLCEHDTIFLNDFQLFFRRGILHDVVENAAQPQ